ncbi:helix-turn-helix domain-containing protein [Tetragenococcus solitarius]|uniref:HTH cro/C1-type domain-containing protein n=1 Tax=Tetragenococcus solitarius TaxID=71453 RepID=A0ABN3Y4B3_9ENTE|nr:helix-turn-helix transcriptional regulator [Tetragenococcus solitarius]
MEIGERLKKQRKIKKWTQQELADKLHISRQSISKWEQGIALPSFANVVAISDLFEISLDELIREDEKLMNNLKAKQKFTPLEKIVWLSISITVLIFALLLTLNANFKKITPWLQGSGTIFLIMLLFSMDWKKINQSFTKRTIMLSIITLVLFLVPFLYDEIISFFKEYLNSLGSINLHNSKQFQHFYELTAFVF